MSTRTLFLEVLKASIDFLLDIQVDQNPQETPEESIRKSDTPDYLFKSRHDNLSPNLHNVSVDEGMNHGPTMVEEASDHAFQTTNKKTHIRHKTD